MNAALYILLAPIRYPISVVMFVIVGFGALVNWALTGSMDHDEGLVGKFMCGIAMMLDFVNKRIIRAHESLRPVGWTFKRAVTNYRKILRWWSDKYADNGEYRQMVKSNIAKAYNGWERTFWTAVKTRGEKLHAERTAEAIKDQMEWETTKSCGKNDPNFLPNKAP
jgi:hypothetical protein